MAEQTILRLHAVMQRTGLSRSSIYHKMSIGEFPQSINLGLRSVGWLNDEISDWIIDRIDESRGDGW